MDEIKRNMEAERSRPPWGNASYFRMRFSMCPDWMMGGLGSTVSQVRGCFSSSFILRHLFASMCLRVQFIPQEGMKAICVKSVNNLQTPLRNSGRCVRVMRSVLRIFGGDVL